MISDKSKNTAGALLARNNGAQVHQTICMECWDYAKNWANLVEKLRRAGEGDEPTTVQKEYDLVFKDVHIDRINGGEHFYNPKAKAKRQKSKLLHFPIRQDKREA